MIEAGCISRLTTNAKIRADVGVHTNTFLCASAQTCMSLATEILVNSQEIIVFLTKLQDERMYRVFEMLRCYTTIRVRGVRSWLVNSIFHPIKACAVKNWTTFEWVYFNKGMEQMKKHLIYSNSAAMRKR